MDKVILVGGFHEIIELCEEQKIKILGIIDKTAARTYCGYPIIGSDENANKIFERYNKVPVIICPDIPQTREKLFSIYKTIGFNFYTLIGKRATISKSASIGTGAIIQNGVNISSYATVGCFVKINTNANIMHDSKIGDFVTIAPNSVILGSVNIGNKVYIGANSTILPDITINESAVVGAGAVVTKSVDATETVVGNPAKRIISKIHD